jgi:hypothetical protein
MDASVTAVVSAGVTRDDGLTDDEGVVLDALVTAIEAFAKLEAQHPFEAHEFVDAIHRCQSLLTLRIARRVFPDGWPVKT